jgi:uncharacterized protein
MNQSVDNLLMGNLRLAEHITVATQRIAPTWPLDQFIAVNPYWGWVGRPIAEAASALGTLSGTQLTMPPEWFRAQWNAGYLRPEHLRAAVEAQAGTQNGPGASVSDAAGTEEQVRGAITALNAPAPPAVPIPLVTDLRDACTAPRPGLTWRALVTHQISQHCAAFFDKHQSTWSMDTAGGLYRSWHRQIDADHGLPWRKGRTALKARLAILPIEPPALIASALDALGIPEEGREAYLTAVLMSVGGWAAWCAYVRWQARLSGADDSQIVDLLAIRIAWEWLLHADSAPDEIPADWASRWGLAGEARTALQADQRHCWLLQSAVEIAYQQTLIGKLCASAPRAAIETPAVQAVFCIDVRSEVYRRALEAASPAVHTRGFAGFFGLPIAYNPVGSALTRPQLPGLLAASQTVIESSAANLSQRLPASDGSAALGQVVSLQRRNALQWRQRWADFRATSTSAFSFVESIGLTYGAKLLSDSLASTATPVRWEDTGLPKQAVATLRPRLSQTTSDPAAAAAMAKGILTAMGLTQDFAPLLLLAGHGSQSANNPHAAGLDCGACGGQTGEVNARVLADLLNAPAVREELRKMGVDIPATTHCLAALHNTTTDEVLLYDTRDVPESLHSVLVQLRQWLAKAGETARAERTPALGLAALSGQPEALRRAVQERANDWAQVRPEWGLADNAAFIVAPRARTRHVDLAGRAFLHDYDWRQDRDLSVLTLIMTAPMVVTHWINMQYHASTVDNPRYGSGNKVLHNVVGGNLGVFEGNGGDLRIGLPMQSVYDGQKFRHTPLRLSVFIEAPRLAIDTVMVRHDTVRDLVEHGWLHLFRTDASGNWVEQFRGGDWVAVKPLV